MLLRYADRSTPTEYLCNTARYDECALDMACMGPAWPNAFRIVSITRDLDSHGCCRNCNLA